MLSRLSLGVKLVLLGFAVSLAANVFLVWQFRTEIMAYRASLRNQGQQLQLTGVKNKQLTRQNQTYEQQIEDQNALLAAKAEQLLALSKQFDDKKAELELKQTELTTAQKQITDQKSQLEANSSELSKLRDRPPLFSFQNKSSSLSDIEAKKEAVKKVVTSAYDVIEEVYGKPYLLHSVTISFVDSFSNDKASGEIVISNSSQGLDLEIRLKDFKATDFADINTLIHEIGHSFHGLAVLEPTAWEEGITVAMTDVVMKKMIAAGSIPSFSPLYIRLTEAEYASKQQSLSIPRDQSAFYGSDSITDMYQVLGKAWYKLYEADSQFFIKFNEAIYAKKNAGQEITEAIVLSTIKEVLPGVSLTGAAWELK